MRSEARTPQPIAAALIIAAMMGIALPRHAAATMIEVTVCGQGQPIRLPLRQRQPAHDAGCMLACHAAETRKRRGTTC